MDRSSIPHAVTTAQLQELGLGLGLAAVGVAPAAPYVQAERAIAAGHEAGRFADLKFAMARPEVSCHPETLVPGAASVVSAALSYWLPEDEPAVTAASPPVGRIARYTRWDAYAALTDRLEQLAGVLRAAGHEARVLVDSNDHVDRAGAIAAGIGFAGKNTNLITRRHGSWVVLGALVTSARLDTTPAMRAGCGDCTACIDACPTDAISDDGVLDTGSCITYWTQSRHSIPARVRKAMGDMVYGCDICQEVCPWNRGAEKRASGADALAGTVGLDDWLHAPDRVLLDRYDRFFIPRRKVRFLRRNALVALGNGGRDADVPLVAGFLSEEDDLLREHARWALERIGTPLALRALASHSE